MTDLEDAFATLERLDAPVTWADVEQRQPRALPPEPERGRGVVAAAVAFAVAAAGITLAVRAFTSSPSARPAATGNGMIAFVAWRSADVGTRQLIYVVNADGSGLTELTSDGARYGYPAWSPDGTMLAVVRIDDSSRGSTWSIWVMAADGSAQREVYHEELSGPIGGEESSAAIGQIAWSPDGGQIAFIRIERVSAFAGEWIMRLYLMNAGGGDVQALTPAALQVHSFSWSPDGGRIVLAGQAVGLGRADLHLYVMNADGSDLTQLGDTAGSDPAWSPDGSRIAFAGHAPGEEESDIFVIDVDGMRGTRLTREPVADFWPVWSPDGSLIVFQQQANRPFGISCRLAVMRSDGSDERTLVDGRDLTGCPFHPAWQPTTGEG
jgi:TolB protein